MVTQTKEVLVAARQLTKVYKTGKVETPALRGVTLDVRAGRVHGHRRPLRKRQDDAIKSHRGAGFRHGRRFDRPGP